MATVIMTPTPDSSNVAAIGHADLMLYVRFKNGKLYCYGGVPFELYQEFLAAPSKGNFFNGRIKGNYKMAEVVTPGVDFIEAQDIFEQPDAVKKKRAALRSVKADPRWAW